MSSRTAIKKGIPDRTSSIPLYAQIKDALVQSIHEKRFSPGDQFPSLTELCRMYSVSAMTARRVLSELANEGYIDVSHGRRTRVAATHPLALSRSAGILHIGIFFHPTGHGHTDSIDHLEMPWTSRVFAAIQRELSKSGTLLTTIPVATSKHGIQQVRCLVTSRQQSPDAFICMSSSLDSWILPLLKQSGKPYVLTHQSEGDTSNCVCVDYYDGSRQVATHLHSTGSKTYLILMTKQCSGVERALLRGFQETLLAIKVEPTEVHVRLADDTSIKAGTYTVREFLDSVKPVIPLGIFGAADHLSLGAMRACLKKGLRVPEDVSIVGGTGLPESTKTTPSLSTLDTPFEEIGQKTVETISLMLKNRASSAPPVILPLPMTIRQSCLMPKSKNKV